MLDNITEISILYDFYGGLLPTKQREIFRLYYEDNLSLGEIAAEYGLTRQGIHETVKRGEKKLRDYDKRLQLVGKFKQEETVVHTLKETIEQLIRDRENDNELLFALRSIEEKLDQLNQ